jgi:hypothetical protein
MTDNPQHESSRRKPPLQFSLKALLTLPIVVGLVFGTLRWLGVPPLAIGVVIAILAVSAIAAVGLLIAVAGRDDNED